MLPLIYFDNIARYVADGGAVLIAAGPDPNNEESVYDTPLAPTLPARPTGAVLEEPFKATVSDLGRRHPVTRDLPGSGTATDAPSWARWFRLVDATTDRGQTVMDGPGGKPLLVLSHEGKGRVAMLLSDHVWLWARGFEGGGPHVPLLRNLAHWLMKEPDLEEESLRLTADKGDLVVERQTLEETVGAVTLTLPDGSTRDLTLAEEEPGRFRARLAKAPLGLYKAVEGDLTALAHVGRRTPRNTARCCRPPASCSPSPTPPVERSSVCVTAPRLPSASPASCRCAAAPPSAAPAGWASTCRTPTRSPASTAPASSAASSASPCCSSPSAAHGGAKDGDNQDPTRSCKVDRQGSFLRLILKANLRMTGRPQWQATNTRSI